MISIPPGHLLVAELVVDWLPLTCQYALHYFIRGSTEAQGSPVTVQGWTPDSLQFTKCVRPTLPHSCSTLHHSLCVCVFVLMRVFQFSSVLFNFVSASLSTRLASLCKYTSAEEESIYCRTAPQ